MKTTINSKCIYLWNIKKRTFAHGISVRIKIIHFSVVKQCSLDEEINEILRETQPSTVFNHTANKIKLKVSTMVIVY